MSGDYFYVEDFAKKTGLSDLINSQDTPTVEELLNLNLEALFKFILFFSMTISNYKFSRIENLGKCY